ncbi:two-component system response regulator [Sulfurimonas sp.]|uniref:response regulator n=1 Tax=Sulfurimonas sp. TaxID=2022749 RepID=UPI003567686E
MNIKKKVMLVDDEIINIDALYRVLGSYYNLVVAVGGSDALEFLNKEELPDLVLLDINMPEIDGYEVCRQMKKSERTKEIPVIFVTAADDERDEVMGFSLGAVDYITKPINIAVLLSRIEHHLGNKR